MQDDDGLTGDSGEDSGAGKAELLKEVQSKLAEIDTIIDSSPVTVLIWSDEPDWPVRFVSRNISRFGYSQEEFVSGRLKYSDIIHPDDVIRLRAEIAAKTGKGIEEWHHEYRIVARTGEIYWVDERTIAVFDEAKRCVRLHGVIYDITRRKAAEEQISRSEQKYRALFDNASDAIFIVDLEANILDVNNAAISMTGYSRDELVSRNMRSIQRSDQAALSDERMNRLRSTGEGSLETVYIRNDGSELPVEVRARLFDYSGKPAVLGFARDITERKMSEDALMALMASLEELESIVNDSPAVVFRWTYDADRIVQFVTNSVRQFGYTPSELLSGERLYSSLIVPEDRDRVLKELMSHHIRRDSAFTLEYRILTKDGAIRWVDDRTIVRREESEGLDRHQGIVVDITARKQAEEALTLANEKLSLMGSVTRHDVMNQLGIIIGALTLMEDDTSDEERSSHLRMARDACSTVAKQLEFAGTYQKAGTKAPEWVHLRLDLLGALSSLDMGSVTVNHNLGNFEVWADPMFEKVMYNLLDNSLRHGKNVTRIDILASEKDDQLMISYEDDGVGIPQESKELIFHRGYGRNTGLGMFLSREILSMTGISMHEVGMPGKGVRFEILVPRGKYRNLAKR